MKKLATRFYSGFVLILWSDFLRVCVYRTVHAHRPVCLSLQDDDDDEDEDDDEDADSGAEESKTKATAKAKAKPKACICTT